MRTLQMIVAFTQATPGCLLAVAALAAMAAAGLIVIP